MLILAANGRVGKYKDCSYETNQMKICFSLMATSCEVSIKDSSSQREKKRVTRIVSTTSQILLQPDCLALAFLELTGQNSLRGARPKATNTLAQLVNGNSNEFQLRKPY